MPEGRHWEFFYTVALIAATALLALWCNWPAIEAVTRVNGVAFSRE